MKTNKLKGIRERLAVAKDITEINMLCNEAYGFRYASDKTKRRWARTGKRRIKELERAT